MGFKKWLHLFLKKFMFKKISFIILFSLIFIASAIAAFKFNPHTGKLDYYESVPTNIGSFDGTSPGATLYIKSGNTAAGAPLLLWDNPNNQLNLGSGTTGNSSTLYIRGAGTAATFALRIADSTPTDRLVVLNNGNVGIGLTNPAVSLQVAGKIGQTDIVSSGTTPAAQWLWQTANNTLGSGNFSLYQMDLDKDTTAWTNINGLFPDIKGDYVIGIHANIDAASDYGFGFAAGVHGTNSVGFGAIVDDANNTNTPIKVWQSGATASATQNLIEARAEETYLGVITGDFTGDFLDFYLSQVGVFRVDNNGIVYPSGVVSTGDIQAKKTSAQGYLEAYNTTGADKISLYHTGTYGALTTNADSLIIQPTGTTTQFNSIIDIRDFTGTSVPTLNLKAPANYDANIFIGEGTTGYGFTLRYDGDASNYFHLLRHNNDATGVIAVAIDRNSGNMGIGVTSPTAKLDIRGDGTGTGFALKIADSTPTDRLVVLDNGNVGIGNTAPSGALDVIGTIRQSGTETLARLYITNPDTGTGPRFTLQIDEQCTVDRIDMQTFGGGTNLITTVKIGRA